MFKNFRAFIRRNTPIIIRRKTLENMIIRLINAMDKNNFSVINPAIRDLECLRKTRGIRIKSLIYKTCYAAI